MRLTWRGCFLWDHRPFNRIRRIKRPLIASQCEETTQPRLAMVPRCTSDAMPPVNFGEEIRRVHRAKVPQRDLLQIWRKVRFPGRLIFRHRRRLTIFAGPRQPMSLGKFGNRQCALGPDLPAIDRPQDFLSQTLQVFFSTVLVTNGGQPLALLLSDDLTILDDVIPIPQEPTSAFFEDESFLRHETFSLPY